MEDTDFTASSFGGTVFAGVDLSRVRGLETCDHQGPSVLDHRTLSRAASLPEKFLRGCGLPRTLIGRLGELFGHVRYHSCFISYSTKNERFARTLERSLLNAGIRYWYAPTSMRGGAAIDATLKARIPEFGRVLVVVSAESLQSRYVRFEVEAAFERAAAVGHDIVVPIRIDETVLRSRLPLAKALRKYVMLDFSRWGSRGEYRRAAAMLVASLEIETDQRDSGFAAQADARSK
jgi:hypothetical protein